MSTFGNVRSILPHNPNKDVEVSHPPNDSVSSLSFSPVSDHLVGTSWDGDVRCWEIQQNGTSIPKAAITNTAPVLCSAWKSDGSAVFTGGCDRQAKMWQLGSAATPVQVGQHDLPIKDVSWIQEMNLLVTSSWDKTLRYWDLRQPNPAHVQQLPAKPYSMSVRHPLMVVGLSDKQVAIFNLNNPQVVFKMIPSPLKYQTTVVEAFPQKNGFLIGGINSKVGIHAFEETADNKNFAYRCHRKENEFFPISVVKFNPVHLTFVTAGGDGGYSTWDKDNKNKINTFSKSTLPILCGSVHKEGRIFAYALGYDWAKGAAHHNPATAKNYIFLHSFKDEDVKPKPKQAGRR